MLTTICNLIRKNDDGRFQFLTSAFASYCVLTEDQFKTLISDLEKLREVRPTSSHMPAVLFPEFPGIHRVIRLVVRKEIDGLYRLMVNVHGDFLCVMSPEAFDLLIKELIELRDGANEYRAVHFPDYTYKITG